MILEIRVGSHEDTESLFLGGVEQLAVLERGPAALVNRDHLVLPQEPPQRDRSPLAEQYAHLGRSQGAARCVDIKMAVGQIGRAHV